MSALDFIGGIFKPLTDVVDKVHTSDAERIEAQSKLESIKNALTSTLLEYETKVLDLKAKLAEMQAKVLTVEMTGASWLQRNWRPMTMINFNVILNLTIASYFFKIENKIPQETINWIMQIIAIGLGGYIGGKTLETVVPAAVKALKKDDK